MGLFDNVLGSVLGGGSNQGSLAKEVIELITNNSSGNGLAGLLQQFEQQGLGNIVQSWVGPGGNQPVSAEQIQKILGSEQIQQLAAKVGLDTNQIIAALTQLLPQVIDQLTPNGQVPQMGDLQQSVGGLLKKFGFPG